LRVPRLKVSLLLEQRIKIDHLPTEETDDRIDHEEKEEIDLPERIDPLEKEETEPIDLPERTEDPEKIEDQEKIEVPEKIDLLENDEMEKIDPHERTDLLEKDESPERIEDHERIDLPEKERKTEVPFTELLERIETRRSMSERSKTLLMRDNETSEPTTDTLEPDEIPRRTRREVLALATGDLRPIPRRNWLPSKVK